MLRMMAMVPPLTPGISMDAPTSRPLNTLSRYFFMGMQRPPFSMDLDRVGSAGEKGFRSKFGDGLCGRWRLRAAGFDVGKLFEQKAVHCMVCGESKGGGASGK